MYVPSQIYREENSTYSLCYNFGGSHGKEKPVDVCHSYRLIEGKHRRQCLGTIEKDLYRPQGFSVEELFIKKALGICTKRDNIAYQANLSDIKNIIEDFKLLEESEIKKKYNITKESRDQKVAYAQRNVKEFGIKDEFFKKALVRPFDSKFTYFTNKSKGFIAFPVYDTMRHLAH